MELLSEEEQWERLKHWLRTNGPSIAVMVAVMLLGWFGWKWWQGRTDAQGAAAGEAYQKVLATLDEGKQAEAFALVEALRSKYPKSTYVYAADMIAAKVNVERNELDKAAERLARVAKDSPDDMLKPVARMRLARVQSALGQHDVALATLGSGDQGTYQSGFLETRGDILLAKGDRAGALQAYEDARKLVPAGESGAGDVAELLDLKIADLRDSMETP